MLRGMVHQTEQPTQEIDIHDGERVMDALSRCGIYLEAPCGGHCLCGKCKVRVLGQCSAPESEEQAFLSQQELEQGVRLACAVRAEGDVALFLSDGEAAVVQMNTRSEPTLHPRIVCEQQGKDWVVCRKDGTILKTSLEQPMCYGMAADIGTTTVAVCIYDLLTGEKLFEEGAANPQRAFGADVIARIGACMADETNLEKQQRLIVDLINTLQSRSGIDRNDIYDLCITGNTTMLHLLTGLNPTGIANFPFTPKSLFGEAQNPAQCGILANVHARLYLPPCCSAYVGGDIVSGMLAAGMLDVKRPCLYIDVGTNGEMALALPDRIMTCSTAAGPAFEGAGIKHGMAGSRGAIANVWVQDETVNYTVIGDGKPEGICGSGILDAAAVLLALGVVDETGRLLDADEVPEAYQDRLNAAGEFVLAEEITVTPQDIREIQLAKAAIAAGISTLLHESGVKVEELEQIVIAGGFGAHINTKSACRIGMLPCHNHVVSIGNAAQMGAVDILLSEEMEARADVLREKCAYIELSGYAYFDEVYVEKMFFE